MLSRSVRPLLRFSHRLQGEHGSVLVVRRTVENPNFIASQRPVGLRIRHFSAKADDSKEQKDTNVKESLQDTVRRMQQKDGANGGADESNTQVDDFMRKARESWSTFSDEVSKTWEDLLRSGDRKDINKKLIQHRPEDTAEGDKPFTGSVAIMVIDESEHLTAWERMQRRLAEAPIISGT